MSEVNLETNERISRRFFNLVLALVRELEAEEDQEGLDVLPAVMITTGVMALCRDMSSDHVGSVLEALKLKVERGDFSGPESDDES